MPPAELSALVARTTEWASLQGILGGPSGASGPLISVSCTFAFLCSPSDCVDHDYDTAGRFLLLFFCFDDLPKSVLPNLATPRDTWPTTPLVRALATWEQDFENANQSSAVLRSRFLSGFHDNLAALGMEIELKQVELTPASHWDYRRRTIFMNPYIDQWLISRDIDIEVEMHEDVIAARRLVIDLVLLSNDLGSVDRDLPTGPAPDDLNLIPTYMRAYHWTQDDAIEHLIRFHNGMVGECRNALERMMKRAGDASRYADVLAGIVDGNIAALEVLPHRYPGTRERVKRLETVWVRHRPRWAVHDVG